MKAIVIGNDATHENQVRQYFLDVAPTQWICDLALNLIGSHTVAQAVEYAIDNSYKIIIRSYTNIQVYAFEWIWAFRNGLIAISAHGSNDHIRLGTPERMLAAIAVSGGISEVVRSYGPGLEIYDQTPAGGTEQSYTTPTVAGKFAYLLDVIDNIPLCRYAMRETAERNSSTHPGRKWNEENGWGKINKDAALNWLMMKKQYNINAGTL